MGWRSPWRSLKGRITLLTSLLWLVSLWVLTFIVSGWLMADLHRLLSANQESVATLVAGHLSHQLAERTEALESVAAQAGPYLGDQRRLQAFLEDKPVLMGLFNGGAYITGPDGVARASIPVSANRVGLGYAQRNHIRGALDRGAATVSEIVVGQALHAPVFGIAVPIRSGDGRVIGALAGVVDLSRPNFVDDWTENTLGETGGYLVVSRDQRLVVTATDRKRSMEKLAPPGVNPKIDFFLNGGEGTTVLVNPLHVEVLVAAHQVGGAPWYVAAATPTAEAFRPVRVLQERMLAVALLLTLLTAVLNWLFLRRELSPIVSTIRTLSRFAQADTKPGSLEVPRIDEIGDLIQGFNRLLATLEEKENERARYEALLNRTQKLDALGLLAGGIAHDFNNLLAGVFGNVELALLKAEGPVAVPLRRTLGILGRARSLTQQLITFSKGGDPELRTGPLFPFVEEATRFALTGSNVVCRFEDTGGLPPCRFDRNQLGQVIDNLVINAKQAMPDGGSLTVSAGYDFSRNQVRISFSDTGPGMPPEVLDKVFEPFFTTKPGGHGLGLTTCYSILHKHGGALEVESEVGRGTTFHLWIPAASSEEAEEMEALPPAHRGVGTLLLVDDEKEVVEVLSLLLHTFGYETVSVPAGEEALEILARDRNGDKTIVAAILDLTIPGGLGGHETLVRLRQIDPTLPALVTSGFAASPVLADPRRFGFAAALRKPYQRADLELALNLLFSKVSQPGPPPST